MFYTGESPKKTDTLSKLSADESELKIKINYPEDDGGLNITKFHLYYNDCEPSSNSKTELIDYNFLVDGLFYTILKSKLTRPMFDP